jgi:3-oxoacyl-[acyl-carrier-protein] synthase III
MSWGAVLLAFALGAVIGACCAADAVVARAGRDQLRRCSAKSRATTLKSNSEVFLQLARERLDRQQQSSTQALKERETAIESLVAPIREALAKTEAQVSAIERDRIDAFATHQAQMESVAGGQICCRAKPATW